LSRVGDTSSPNATPIVQGLILSATPDNIRPLRRPAAKASSSNSRWRANWPAELRCERLKIRCSIIDISAGGAKLKIDGPLPPRAAKVWLVIEGCGPIAAEPVWRRSDRLGLRFFEDHPVIARLQSQRFDPAAWLEKSEPGLGPAK
jgi:PilZ domain